MVHSDTNWRYKTVGYVIRTVVQEVDQDQGQKDISGYQSSFLSSGGVFTEQENITSPDSTLGKLCVINENSNSLWQILFEFGLEDNGVDGAKKPTWQQKVRKVEDGSNIRQIISQISFKTCGLNFLPR